MFDLAEFCRLRDAARLQEFEARLPMLREHERKYRGYLARVERNLKALKARNAASLKALKASNATRHDIDAARDKLASTRHDIDAAKDKLTAIWQALSPVLSEINIIETELPLLSATVASRAEGQE